MEIKNKSKEPTKPKKNVRKTIDLHSIKRPQTAFFQFCAKMRRNRNPEEKYAARELGNMWKRISDSEKKPYIDRYEEEKKKY